VDESIFEEHPSDSCASPESGYQPMSILDMEYNRLFGGKNQENNCKCTGAACRPQYEDIYSLKPKVALTRSSESDATSDGVTHRSVSASNVLRSHSPISDNSLSSSSGISSHASYYSAFVDIPRQTGVPQSPVYKLPPRPPKHVRQPSDPTSAIASEPVSKPVTKSNSFRLFNSPKLLKKFSTPKYQRERRQEKEKLKTPDDVKEPKNFFLNSPKLARALMSFRKEASGSNSESVSSSEPVDDGPGPYEGPDCLI